MQEFLKNSIAASCQVKERTFLAAMPQEFSGKQINLYRFPAKKNRMTKTETLGFTCFVLIGLVLMVAVPVSAVTVGSSPAAALTSPTASPSVKPTINATISSSTPTIGDPITLSGIEKGSNTSTGVQLWIFAGKYVNVTKIPVSADGSFSKTFDSTGYPAAKYYVFFQSPGPDGKFNINLQNSGIYSGEVINSATGAQIFNFTGVGSVQDDAAAQALSNAINNQGNDDVYTKLTYQLMAQQSSATVAVTKTSVQPSLSVPTTTSPVQIELPGIALALAALVFLFNTRRK